MLNIILSNGKYLGLKDKSKIQDWIIIFKTSLRYLVIFMGFQMLTYFWFYLNVSYSIIILYIVN